MKESNFCEDCQSHYEGDECPYCSDDGRDEDYYREQREDELEERAALCKCGAWQFSNEGAVIHVADCCCGAE